MVLAVSSLSFLSTDAVAPEMASSSPTRRTIILLVRRLKMLCVKAFVSLEPSPPCFLSLLTCQRIARVVCST